MSRLYLNEKASRARLKEATAAREDRRDIVKALSWGQVSRRELLKLGLFTGAGLLAPIRGLNPFVSSAYGSDDLGIPSSPLFGVQPFTQPMLRFDLLPRAPMSPTTLNPAPTKEANTAPQLLDPDLVGGARDQYGPIEGRPPGPDWAHQDFERLSPRIAVEVGQEGARINATYDPGCDAVHNSGVSAGTPCPPCFHPQMPVQNATRLWTFNGSIPRS